MNASSLAIDAGQSGIKVRHIDASHSREWTGPGLRTDLPLAPQLQTVILDALTGASHAATVCVGVSGLKNDGHDDAALLLAAAAPYGVQTVHLAHDSTTAYLAALGDRRGAVVASGTGVVTLAVGAADVSRVDGWGHLIGDAGSGYWLGRAALDAVMRAHDGRGVPTSLTDVVEQAFPDIEEAYIELQSDPDRVQRIASFARPVAEAAEAGDRVAASLLAEAARELALSAIAGLKRVGEIESTTPCVRGVGGTFNASLLARRFNAEVQAQLPSADVGVGQGNPLDGAAALAGVASCSALASRISTAHQPRN